MTIEQAIRRGAKQLEDAAIPSARLDTLLLLELATKRDKSWLLAHQETKIAAEDLDTYKRLLGDRAKRRPMAYIRGQAEFYGLTLSINDNVLSPRAETETIVDLAITLAPKKARFIDIGTGSGAIAVAVAKQRPDLSVAATDISDSALDVARDNSAKHNVNIDFYTSDLLGAIEGKFDVLAANLPYLTADKLTQPETLFEPKTAFIGGGKDGLNLYRKLFEQLQPQLNKNGYVLAEAEPWQHKELASIAKQAGFKLFHQEGLVVAFRG